APGVVGEGGTIAFRVTNHPFAAALARSLGAPIVSTSANISSYSNPYDIEYITSMFDGREYVPDLIIDAGNLPHHSPSTIVKVEADGTKIILRQGEIII
ncbi:MAG: Sua5/YciO/YrdC/YwlC family protein, partial [Candidatus Magasanikbacteria bacterium]|nr:Sua5/YciO/YrdC/YwlC family protein [Candidatus Magasanikbacteria bacterium]